MSFSREIQARADLGRPRECLELALRWAEVDPDEAIGVLTALRAALKRQSVTPAFHSNLLTQRRHLEELCRSVGEEYFSHFSPWWFGTGEPVIGRIAFPLTILDDGSKPAGVVRFVQIAAGSQPSSPRYAPRDAAFLQAVESARRLASTMLDADLSRCHLAILPDLPSNVRLSDTSVGLAAFLAFASFELRLAPHSEWLATGCLERGRIVPVGAATLTGKCDGRLQWPALRHVLCPGHDLDWHGASQPAGPVESPVDALDVVLGPGWRAANQASFGRVSRNDANSGELKQRVRALLAASAPGPLHICEIDEALHVDRAWRTATVKAGVPLQPLLDDMTGSGEASSPRKGHYAISLGTFVSPEYLLAAHRALGELYAGAEPDQSRYLDRALHLAMSRRTDDARAAIRCLLATEPLALPKVMGVVVDRVADEDSSLARSLCEDVGDSLACRLLELAWLCRDSTAELNSAWTQLEKAETPVDRLLWLQAVAERVLYQLLAAAILEASELEKPPFEHPSFASLAKRPSIGDLAKGISLCVDASVPGGEVLPWLHGIWTQKLQSELATLLTGALHRSGVWNELTDTTGDELADQRAQPIADALLPLLRCFSTNASGLAPQSELPGPLIRAVDGYPPLFYRGMVRASESSDRATLRYWCFDSLRIFHTIESSAVPALGSPSTQAAIEPWRLPRGEMAALRIDRLPLPIAHGVAHLLRSISHRRWIAAIDGADLAFSVLLRLAWWPIATVASTPAELSAADRRWVGRSIKRNLFNNLVEAEGAGPQYQLATWMQRDENVDGCWDVIEILERLEHAPPPLSGCAELVESLHYTLSHLLSRAPFCASEMRLIGNTLDGVGVDLMGPRSTPASPGAPGLDPGEVAWVSDTGVASLGPFAIAVAMRNHHSLAWIRDARKSGTKSKRKMLWHHHPTFLSTSIRGVLSQQTSAGWVYAEGRKLSTWISGADGQALRCML